VIRSVVARHGDVGTQLRCIGHVRGHGALQEVEVVIETLAGFLAPVRRTSTECSPGETLEKALRRTWRALAAGS
jgi:hypothetical protein